MPGGLAAEAPSGHGKTWGWANFNDDHMTLKYTPASTALRNKKEIPFYRVVTSDSVWSAPYLNCGITKI